MASFHAELHLAGTSYRVVRCQYACHQPTDERGRVNAKVRHDLLHLTLDVPDDDALLAWAAAPFKAQAGEVVFYDATQRVPHETIAFTAGQCVNYHETFESGAGRDGAYVCQLSITAPAFELRSGGPAALASAMAMQQVSQVASVTRVAQQASTAVLDARENSSESGMKYVARQAGKVTLDPDLARIIESTLLVASNSGPGNPEPFEAAVLADLQALYNTSTGRQMLESLHASGKKLSIQYADDNMAAFEKATWERAFYQEDGITPGQGVALAIKYNPFLAKTGALAWNNRPPGIGLAHELIHAEQAAYGRMRRLDAPNPGGPDSRNPGKLPVVRGYELDTIGVHPEHQYAFTENKIRAEWNPPQGRRDYY